MKRMLCIIGAAGATLLTGGLLLAQQPPPDPASPPPARTPAQPSGGQRPGGWTAPGRDGMDGFMVDRLVNDAQVAKQLNLATNQTSKLLALRADMQKQMVDLLARRDKAAHQQAELVIAANPDEAAVMKAVEATGAAQIEIAKAQVKHLLAVMKVLTPEQQQKLNQLREQAQKRRAEYRDKRGPAGTNGAAASPPPPPPANQ